MLNGLASRGIDFGVARKIGDGPLVEISESLEFESVNFPLAAFNQRDGGPCQPDCLCDLILRQSQVLAGVAKANSQTLPVIAHVSTLQGSWSSCRGRHGRRRRRRHARSWAVSAQFANLRE